MQNTSKTIRKLRNEWCITHEDIGNVVCNNSDGIGVLCMRIVIAMRVKQVLVVEMLYMCENVKCNRKPSQTE